VTRSPAIAALLHGSVDYAGLFPPAGLAMSDAVARYGAYVAGTERAMLGRFVVPAARLDECAAAVNALPTALAPNANMPWRLSALAGAADADSIAGFHAREGARLLVDTIEAKAESDAEIASLGATLAARYTTFVEIPVREDPSALIAGLGEQGLRAKIRTGGVTPEAFPAPATVLRFLVACVRAQVPFKATAGLHHPLRGEYPLTYAADAPRGTMYGFLNIFLTTALLHAGVAPADAAPMLEERDASSLVIDGASMTWRAHRLSADDLARTRALLAGAFGSCSFEEPVQDLQSLGLL
jgi:hypothetical protein